MVRSSSRTRLGGPDAVAVDDPPGDVLLQLGPGLVVELLAQVVPSLVDLGGDEAVELAMYKEGGCEEAKAMAVKAEGGCDKSMQAMIAKSKNIGECKCGGKCEGKCSGKCKGEHEADHKCKGEKKAGEHKEIKHHGEKMDTATLAAQAEKGCPNAKAELIAMAKEGGCEKGKALAEKAEGGCARCELTGARLAGAELGGADLTGADLSRADLSRADLGGAILAIGNLSKANLSGADLSGADLSDANLAGAELNRASLVRARLLRADLAGASLAGADLSQASLPYASLAGTNLAGAVQLDGLSLSGFDGLTFGAVTLSGGPVSLDSKGSNIQVTTLTGAQDLTLAGGIGAGTTTVTGDVSNLGDGTGAARYHRILAQNGGTVDLGGVTQLVLPVRPEDYVWLDAFAGSVDLGSLADVPAGRGYLFVDASSGALQPLASTCAPSARRRRASRTNPPRSPAPSGSASWRRSRRNGRRGSSRGARPAALPACSSGW